MKLFKIIYLVLLVFVVSSCNSVQVAADYDTTVDFSKYKTYAFYKKGIAKVDISDIDKKRILRALESELGKKGMTPSENPDLIISIFAKSTKKVNVYQDYNNYGGYYYGYWSPWYYGPNYGSQVTVHEEGTLFVDFIDNKKKELVWQGIGKGALVVDDALKKEARINEFIQKILEKYPPFMEK
ncbi:MAG: DUF4136 domain-containing protein [Flavobacteriaceae bacterium]|nr:DUF4136 domain-containing protein [Flavobacteriaceae bacterium]